MRKITALLLLLCILLCGCQNNVVTPTATAPTIPSIGQGELQVHFIDVGQGDCILLECDDMFALVDGGYPEDGMMIVDYLEEQNVQELSLVVGTHPHGDHIGGLPHVMSHFPVKNVWFSAYPYANNTVRAFLNAAKMQRQEVQEAGPGYVFSLGRATITVLGPIRTDYEDVNDLSLVLMVQFGDTKFLLTGDMESIAEIDLVESGVNLKADVLKVGHHGSYSSTSYRFLREVMPTYGVISCGLDNEYGHPHDAPMSRLRDADVIVYRTDHMSHIVAISDGTNITFTYANEEAELPNAA